MITKTYLLDSLRSKYCLGVLLLALIFGYYLLPRSVFYSFTALLAFLFLFLFSLSTMCLVRNIKERVILSRASRGSFLGLVATAIGLGALQVCGLGAPVCGATVGVGIISFFFPTLLARLTTSYALALVLFSIVLEIVSLYFMNCFKEMGEKRT